MEKLNLLVIDDNQTVLNEMEKLFAFNNAYKTTYLDSVAQLHVEKIIVNDNFDMNAFLEKLGSADLVLLDKNLQNVAQADIRAAVQANSNKFSLIVYTGDQKDYKTFRDMFKKGVLRIALKDPNRNDEESFKDLKLHVAGEVFRLIREKEIFRRRVKSEGVVDFNGIKIKSNSMKQIREEILSFQNDNVPILLTGETGTGKNLIANAIHMNSSRKDKPFMEVNCAESSKDEDKFHSEIFGHEKGAFTGAVVKRKGKFEEVGSGTIFLNEINSLSLNMQAKLLRVLDDTKEFEALGNNRKLKFSGRIIAAANKDLSHLVANESFRRDLYYRIDVYKIEIPPLCERKEDIQPIAEYFIKYGPDAIKKDFGITSDSLQMLNKYGWPGNIRELRNVIEYALVTATNEVAFNKNLSEKISLLEEKSKSKSTNDTVLNKDSQKRAQKEALIEALKKTSGNVTKAAEVMGISREHAQKLKKDFGIKK